MPNERTDPSIVEPLRNRVFRELWIAGVVSNVGTWMQNAGGAWFMAVLTPSATMVALMQTATSLPIFLVGLPGGALADVVDRRKLLLVTQAWMLGVAAALAGLTLVGRTTPALLLILTFALGIGAALNTPAWQAISPEVVTRRELPAAVALSGVSVNIARAVGPALGGFILAATGAGWVFALNALSFVAVLAAVWRWRRVAPASDLPAEDFGGAIRAAWRYVRHSAPLHAVLARAALFVLSASALWALLPVVARQDLGLSALGFGTLQGCLGVGALGGALAVSRVRRTLSIDTVAVVATALFASATLALGIARNLPLLCGMMIVGGIAWIAMMTSFNVAVLMSAPRWVQARSVAVYMLVFQGSMAGASALWGAIAERFGNSLTLTAAAATLVGGFVIARRIPLHDSEAIDLSPSLRVPEPVVVVPPEPEDGPVLVLVEYQVRGDRANDFFAAMELVRPIRLRDGAIRWELFRDPAKPGRFIEAFVTDSWAEHLRQHQRVTVADRAVIDYARSFHVGDGGPVVSHFVAEPVARQ
jgi:MFS family permease/quinol monooxygenase YgiN